MKILAVCSFGVGSSLILKLTIDKAFKRLGIEDGESENIDLSVARSTPCDVIFTCAELVDTLHESTDVPIFAIKRYMDIDEVSAAVEQAVKTLEEKR